MVPTEIAKQKQPMLRLFLSVKSLEHLSKRGKNVFPEESLDAKAIVERWQQKTALKGGF